MAQTKIVTFLDNTGRIIHGAYVSESNIHLSVSDPAQIYVQPTQNGQLNVQSIPLFFKEFVKNTDPVIWEFNKANITMSPNLELDERLIVQYHNILNKPALQPAAPPTEAKVIKLFED